MSLCPRDAASDAVEAGRAPAVGRGAGQSLRRHRGRRRGRDRRRLRTRRACRPARNLDAARHRRADGAAHAIGDYDAATGRYTLYAGSGTRRRQGAAGPRRASSACRRSRCAALCDDMGGNFGTRNFFYPEYASAAVGGAPRRPAGQMDVRAQRIVPQRLPGPRPHRRGRAGARRRRAVSSPCAGSQSEQSRRPRHCRSCRCARASASCRGSIAFRPSHFRGRAALTNTAPTTPYRSAGRPEAIFVIERLVDLAAARAAASIRSRCAAATSSRRHAQPYTNGSASPTTTATTGGMDAALALADWDGFAARAQRRRAGAAGCAASGSATTSRSPAVSRASGPRSRWAPEAGSSW